LSIALVLGGALDSEWAHAAPSAVKRRTSASARPSSARGLRAGDLDLDLTPTSQVLALWRRYGRTGSGDGRSRAEARRIAATLPYRTLRDYLREQFTCGATAEEVARGIELPDSGICGFGMDPAFRDRAALASLDSALAAHRPEIATRAAARAAAYLPTAPSWRPIHIWFVVASQTMFDAATLPPTEGRTAPVILINLTEVLSYGATTSERLAELEHVLAHETFHAGMRQVDRNLPGWAAAGGVGVSVADVAQVARVMVDEGVAHYIDWRDRPGTDSVFTWKPSGREAHAFAQLATAVRRLKDPRGQAADRLEVLQLAGNGPLWSKYAAISGLFAAYRIEMARGRAALRRAIVGGPVDFIRSYREVAAHNPALNGAPKELIQ